MSSQTPKTRRAYSAQAWVQKKESETQLVSKPFRSEAQRRWMYANHPEMAAQWEKDTPKGEKLPEHNASKSGEITSDAISDSGKKLPAQGKLRSGVLTDLDKKVVRRQKVVGILEETDDGEVYLTHKEEENDEGNLGENDPEREDEEGSKNSDDQEMVPVTAEKSLEPDEGASWICPIIKADTDQRLVTGIVLQPETVDAQGDIYDADVIKAAAHDYMRQYNAGNVIGFMHKDMNRSLDLVESWTAPCDLEIEGKAISKGTWMMTVYVADSDAWDKVKKGQITGFSIGGIAKVEKL